MQGQHGGGHRAHASGDRRDGSHDGLHLVKGHVPMHGAVRADVDAHIYHHLARAHIVGPDQVQAAGGGDDDVGVLAEAAGVLLVCEDVTDGDGGLLLHQQQGGGQAHGGAFADHSDLLAFQGDIIVVEQFQAGGGGAGGKADVTLGEQAAHGGGGDGVDVFLRGQDAGHRLGVQMGRQGAE